MAWDVMWLVVVARSVWPGGGGIKTGSNLNFGTSEKTGLDGGTGGVSGAEA